MLISRLLRRSEAAGVYRRAHDAMGTCIYQPQGLTENTIDQGQEEKK